MSMDVVTFKADLKAMRSELSKLTDGDEASDLAADLMAAALIKLIKSAKITVTALPGEINVVGSASAQSNAAAITLIGNDDEIPEHPGGIE